MPYRNPFFFSKRGLQRIDKIREQQEREAELGPDGPAKVNNYKTANTLTVAKSLNVHPELVAEPQVKDVHEVESNKPTVAKSINIQPAETIPERDVEELIPAVNGKAAPQLVGKKPSQPQEAFVPVIEKTEKKARTRRKRKTS